MSYFNDRLVRRRRTTVCSKKSSCARVGGWWCVASQQSYAALLGDVSPARAQPLIFTKCKISRPTSSVKYGHTIVEDSRTFRKRCEIFKSTIMSKPFDAQRRRLPKIRRRLEKIAHLFLLFFSRIAW